MKKRNVIQAIKNPRLFGSLPAFKSLATWKSWLVWLQAAFALPMDPDELATYQKCTGRSRPPRTEPKEIYTICGRRGGKSFISALTAVYFSCFGSYRQYLTVGERAAVLVLARDRDQARIVFSYIKGIFNFIQVFRQMIVTERADEVELDNGVVILVKTCDYRAVRGLTIVCTIADEAAFWDDGGVNPAKEIFSALRPAMATIPTSKLLVISTPYMQNGPLYEAHRDYFGVDDDSVLVWQADTETMNPTVSAELIRKEIERDPDSARAEWQANFRDDLESAFGVEALDACTIKGRDELPASPIISYSAFVDPSGGRADSFALAIGHKEKDKAVLDLLRAWAAPFDPAVVVGEAAAALKGYGVSAVVGDNYGGEWPVSSFRTHGIGYERCESVKSELYLALIPTVNSKKVELLDNRPLIEQLRRLERRRGRLGKDAIDHPARLHDDVANAAAGVAYLLLSAEASQNHGGFNAARHIADEKLEPIVGSPLYVGLTIVSPIASVIAQVTAAGAIQILAAFASEGGLSDHVETQLKPWIRQHVGVIRNRQAIIGTYDNSDLDMQSAYYLIRGVEEQIFGTWDPPMKPWAGRRETMTSLFSKVENFTHTPMLRVSPEATLVPPALSRPWDPKDKAVYAAIANAVSLCIDRIDPGRPKDEDQGKTFTKFDARFI
jgi:hypothetical protein